ncbi:MAG: alpha/beta fold hydrolase [Chloroflexi bacterium]|nr:alpha/beta fold hydrolase [Chloroflexota bacterium]
MSDEGPIGTLHHALQGVGEPPFVLLHANPLDSSMWLYQAAHLGTWHRILTIDLPGYGHSRPLRGPTTMEMLAAAIWRIVDEAGLRRPIIAGVSIGGSLALHMARLRSSEVRALVLTGTSHSPDKAFARRRIEGYRRDGLRYRQTHIDDGLAAGFTTTDQGRALAAILADRGALVDIPSVIRLFEAHGSPDPSDLYEVQAPVLIINGDQDYALAGSQELHRRIAGSEHVVIEGAGHACMLERPDEWDRVVLGSLRRMGVLVD